MEESKIPSENLRSLKEYLNSDLRKEGPMGMDGRFEIIPCNKDQSLQLTINLSQNHKMIESWSERLSETSYQNIYHKIKDIITQYRTGIIQKIECDVSDELTEMIINVDLI